MSALPSASWQNPGAKQRHRFRQALDRTETVLLGGVLAAMALLPLVEALLRALFQTGISGAASFTQHLALIAGMQGAALAARDGRLLSLSALPGFLTGRVLALTRLFTGCVAVSVSALLLLASLELVSVERAGSTRIAYSIPVWIGQAALPFGFLLIVLRLACHAAEGWTGRLLTLLVASAVGWAAADQLPLNDTVVLTALILLLMAAALGSPIFAILGGSALVLFWKDGLPIASIPLDHYRLVVNPSLPMIPLFALAGYLLAEGGAPQRLIRVFESTFAGMRAGPAIVTVLTCTLFTAFSGASGVTIIALGGMLMPLLLRGGYSEKRALGLIAGAGSLGGLLPPGLPLVLYALVAKIPLEEMFLAGIVPGLLILALIALWGVAAAPRSAAAPRRFDWKEVRVAVVNAKWELLVLPLAFFALFGGFATPVEAAALVAVYAFVVEVFLHRDLNMRSDVPRVFRECGLLIGGVLLILGVALGLANYLVDAQIPERAADWVKGHIDSRVVFLLTLNVVLLAAGCFLDMFSAIVVLVPLVLPLGIAFGVDPLHLGIVFLVNLELGYLTPPVGMNLFFTAYRFGKPLPEVFLAALPPAGVLLGAVLIVTFAPWLATGLPQLMK
jgi:tripartite ATP-independent transporter DctM subunit